MVAVLILDLVKQFLIYCNFLIFNMAAAAILDFGNCIANGSHRLHMYQLLY